MAQRNWLGWAIGLAIVSIFLVIRGFDPPLISNLRASSFDTMQRLWPRSGEPAQPVRIVDIDEASLKELGQWPWPRNKIAKLVDELHELGAAAIVFDVIFAEPDRMSPDKILSDPDVAKSLGADSSRLQNTMPNYDELLAKSIAAAPVVNAFATGSGVLTERPLSKAGFAQMGLPALEAPYRLSRLTQNLGTLDQAASGLGSIGIDLAGDQGITRQIPLLLSDGKSYFPSLALEALRVAQGANTYLVLASSTVENTIQSVKVGNIDVPCSESCLFTVYYRHNSPELYVSAADVIRGNQREDLRPRIEGNIVFVGTSAIGLLDTKTSTLGEAIPGVSVHAQAVEQILSGNYLSRPHWAAGAEVLVVAVAGALLSFFSRYLPPYLLFVIGAVLSASVIAIAIYAFRLFGLLLDITFPIVSLTSIFLANIAFKLLVVDREGRQMRRVFSHYVAPSILSEIENNPAALNLGGDTRDITVMFVDIENFTPLGEKLKATELVQLVNGILSACSKAILNHGGTIDKYIGDGVMAFWNAPIATPDHQYHAALAGLAIQNEMTEFNDQATIQNTLQPPGLWPVSVRVGLASGPAVVGNMGSLERFDYSALGETVNIAARAESVCKHVGWNIVIAGDVSAKTTELALLNAGMVEMKGKSMRMQAHIVAGDEMKRSEVDFAAFQNAQDEIIELLVKTTMAKKLKITAEAAAARLPLYARYLQKLVQRKADFAAP